jgi:DNA-binding response OmpR family regulator
MARILVVDDEPGFRRSLSRLLEMDGHEIIAAANGREALRLLSGQSFDLVITDVVMPELDGVELMEALRQASREIPVILITGHPTADSSIKAVRFGAVDYLTKPFSKREISLAVDQALGAKRISEESKGLGRPSSHGLAAAVELDPDDQVRIAIIDDEENIITLVERVLASRGYLTQGVRESIGASAKIRAFDPHIIILDLNMPALDGRKVLEIFRRTLPKMPRIIIFSGADPEELEQVAASHQVDDYVYKGDGIFRLLGRVNLHVHRLKADRRTLKHGLNPERFV